MKKDQSRQREDSIEIFEQAIKGSSKKKYLPRLYIAGTSARSTRAMNNLKQICEEHLKDRFELEVIDIYQQPAIAEGEQIIAAPTLVKKLPPPLRKFIGDLADTEKILVGLDIKSKADK